MNKKKMMIACVLLASNSVLAQQHEGHGAHQMPMDMEMDMSGMEMDMDMPGMQMDQTMDHRSHGAEENTAPALRDPHAFADGYDFGPIPPPQLADEHYMGGVMVNRLESRYDNGDSSAAYDLRARYGRDYQGLVLKAEGHVDGGELEEAATELYWSQAIAPFWDMQLGLRHDSGIAPDRTWLAAGIEGLAPYWFELGATFYVSDAGRAALNLEAEYELLLTQRLILQPSLELDIQGGGDAVRETGSGMSEAIFGLRLRYEIWREVAPYVGLEWNGKYGGTADFARAAGEETKQTRAVAGVRFWF